MVEEARDTSDMVLGFSEKNSSAESAKRAAKKYNVAPATVRRDADYARAVDRLGEVFGREFKSWILAVAKLGEADGVRGGEVGKGVGHLC